MKIRAVVQDVRWRYLAALLDTRILLVFLCLLVLVVPLSGFRSNTIDNILFRLGVKLQSQHLEAGDYVRVDVSAEEMQGFLHDPVGAMPVMRFLDLLQSSQMRSAVVVLHSKLWQDYAVISLLEHANLSGVVVQQDSLLSMKKNIGIYQSFLVNKNIDRRIVADSSDVHASLYPVIPFFSVENGGVIPEQIRYPLSSFSDRSGLSVLRDKIVVIGERGDLAADDMLMSDASIRSASFANFAPWYTELHIVVSLLILAYLFLLPICTLRVGAFLSLLFVLGFFLGQQIVFIVHRIWFPIFPWLAFLLTGHCLVFLWCVRKTFYAVSRLSFPDEVNGDAPVVRKSSRQVEPKTAFWRFAKKQPQVRVSPTMEGRAAFDDFDDTTVLEQTRAINRESVRQDRDKGRKLDFLGRYKIERELGRGAMGVVYLGFDPKISRKVAIKTLHYNQFDSSELPAVKERFFREAAAAGKLRHPNIVTIYDAGEEADLAYIAMDYVQGDSLSAHIRKDQLLDVELVYYIMALVSDAVSDANSQGIIHRDIKPSNILYDSKTNEVKVADFGIARILDGSATRTKTGELVGSPLYMSPEQIKGEHVGPQSDIFSLGVTFYQLLTGELPFKGDSLANLSYQIIQCKYRPVDEVRPGLPASAQRIIARALNKSPASRFHSAADMHDAIQKAYMKEFS